MQQHCARCRIYIIPVEVSTQRVLCFAPSALLINIPALGILGPETAVLSHFPNAVPKGLPHPHLVWGTYSQMLATPHPNILLSHQRMKSSRSSETFKTFKVTEPPSPIMMILSLLKVLMSECVIILSEIGTFLTHFIYTYNSCSWALFSMSQNKRVPFPVVRMVVWLRCPALNKRPGQCPVFYFLQVISSQSRFPHLWNRRILSLCHSHWYED